MALEPEAADEIPANVRVQILPTTLFGQKFVSFVPPENPSADSLADGDVIPSDRVETNVELSKILADLFPLLRAVEPAAAQLHPQRARDRARGPRRPAGPRPSTSSTPTSVRSATSCRRCART